VTGQTPYLAQNRHNPSLTGSRVESTLPKDWVPSAVDFLSRPQERSTMKTAKLAKCETLPLHPWARVLSV